MDSKYEVYYYPFQSRGEYVRLLLVAAKAHWENKTVNDWEKEKFTTEGLLFKQIPMLIEHTSSGKEFRLVQVGAIVRYIANTFGLVTDCPCKNALLDSYYVGLYEIINTIIDTIFTTKENLTEALRKLSKSEWMTKNLSYQEGILERNGSNGHYLSTKLTYVDIIAFGFVDAFLNYEGLEGLFSKKRTPNLLKVYHTISKNPEISAYLKSEKRLIRK